MENLFIFMELFAICVTVIAMVLLMLDDGGAREQKLMGYFLCGSLIQCVGYLLELTAPTMEAAIMAVKIEYLGSITVPLCYCWFMYNYCYQKSPRKLLNVLGTIDAVVLVIIFTLDWHHLYYRQIEWLQTESGHHYLDLSYGPVYPVFMICSCIIPYCLSLYVLLRTIRERPEEAGGRKYKIIMFLSIFPTLALFAYASKLTYVYDLTPAALGIVLSLVVILIWRSRTYDFKRLAADVLLDNMGDGVIATDGQKRVLSYNPAAAAIFPSLSSCKQGDSIAKVPEFPESILEENDNQEFSINGRFYESHVKRILNKYKQNQGYVVLVLDVTNTRNYIEEIKRVHEQAEQANMAKSEFLANMSHEIRTPMNAIIGLSDIIMEESAGRKLYTYASDIKSASRNLLAIINDILDLSKVEAGKMELVISDYHVKSMVDEILHMMDMAASRKGILLKYDYDEEIPCRYSGDEGRIKQILINLINNAIKFTKEGYVRVSVEGTPGEAEDEEILTFRVRDTGCGIRKEDMQKIFEDFRQVDSKRNRSAEGTGLGLAITKHLVQLMHGKIEVESVYGVGTMFTVMIPQKIVDKKTLKEMPDFSEKNEEQVEIFVAETVKVLIVDDNLINRKVARGFLNAYRFQLEEAASGFEAIELVKKEKYDIIFMDHMMPEMDGIEALQIIRRDCGENGASPVVIALTANAMEGVREKFLSSGFQDFLPKPLDRKSLNNMLMKWIPEELRKEQTSPWQRSNDDNSEESGADQNSQIAGIDNDTMAKLYDSYGENYRNFLSLFCMDGERKLELLEKLYKQKDITNYEIEVHGLKSASANIGAMELSAIAKEHEGAAKRGDHEYIDGHYEELMDVYKKQIAAIKQYLGEDSAETGTDLGEIEHDVLIAEIREALEKLEHFQSKQCAEQLENLLQYRLEKNTANTLRKVLDQLKLYEDSEAEELLHEFLGAFIRTENT